MAAHGAPECGARLPDAVPLEISHVTRLSWELGTRVVDDEEATLHSQWQQEDTFWELDVYQVTHHTDLLRVQTPVGREQFYGVTQSELESAITTLEAADRWRRAD